ncbi:hypothetical protein BCR43DRAFT_498377 [Syncephalastrum racemosum]|uniref:Uncharacterized protein n=1 Tax=Syncephalastrum racemosum TaxID=13706 RepID=A0A1X2H0T7_SYNRA|nr:hypothetical protein BCR43DRAFT_498377 [Syncephalastrum racemosum]
MLQVSCSQCGAVSTSKAYEKTLQIKIKEKDDTKLYMSFVIQKKRKGTKGSSKSVSQCRNGMLQLGVFGGVLQ